MPGSSSNAVVVLVLFLLPAGLRGENYCNGDANCNSNYCNGGFISPGGALVITDNVTSVADYAFYGCTSLASVSFSNSRVTRVGDNAFYGCTALASVSFSNSSVTTVGNSAFLGCTALASVSFSNSRVITVGESAFYSCTTLGSVSFSNSRVTTVGDYAFYSCTSLESVSFSNSRVTTVGDNAFHGCTKLASVVYGDNYNPAIDIDPTAFLSSGCQSNFNHSHFTPPGACKCVPLTFTATNRSAACVLKFGVNPTSDRLPQMWRNGTAAAQSGFITGYTEIVPGFDPSHTDTTLADLFENARPGLDGNDLLIAFSVESNYATGDPNFGNRSGVSLGDALFVSATGTMSLKMDNPGNHTVQLIARTGRGPPELTQPAVVLDWTVQVELPGNFGLRQGGPKGCGQGYMNELQANITEVLRKIAPRHHRHDVKTTVELPGIDTSRCNFLATFTNAATDDATDAPQISFGVVVEDWDTNATADLGKAPFYTDTGQVLLQLQKEGRFRAKLQAFTVRSDGRQTLNLTEMTLDVRLPDTYGNVAREKRGCSSHGAVTEDVDGSDLPVLQNDEYVCHCIGPWTGDDCETKVVPDPVEGSAKTVEITLGAVAALAITIGLALRLQVYRLRHRPEDVSATQDELMQSPGLLAATDIRPSEVDITLGLAAGDRSSSRHVDNPAYDEQGAYEDMLDPETAIAMPRPPMTRSITATMGAYTIGCVTGSDAIDDGYMDVVGGTPPPLGRLESDVSLIIDGLARQDSDDSLITHLGIMPRTLGSQSVL